MKSPENINLISAEQQERQEKFAELLDMMSSLPETFKDSNDAYEVTSFIDEFKEQLEGEGVKLKDYLLGGVLLSSEDTSNVSNYPYYDTEDSKIEKFIRRLYEEQLNKNAA